MNDTESAILYGVLGSFVGIVGSVFGVRATLKQCKTAAERRVVWQLTLGIGLLVAALLAGLFLIPRPFNWLVWIPYPFLLIGCIGYGNRKLAALRGVGQPEVG
jgi:hypothetical protein